jgi:hypothetical protein
VAAAGPNGRRVPTVEKDHPPIADAQSISFAKPCAPIRTSVAGLFLFWPLLARLRFEQLVAKADYPGSKMVPATSALLSLLALKLLDAERRSHIADYGFDGATGMFAGLPALPKATFAIDYSYRTHRPQQEKLLAGWVAGLLPLLDPNPDSFSLDFHSMPHRGDPEALENHFVPMRGKAVPSVLTFFAQAVKSRVLCYSSADVIRAEQPAQLLEFVEFVKGVFGREPSWLYFDSKFTTYAQINRLMAETDTKFITIRRRGARMLRALEAAPAAQWKRTTIDIPKRRCKAIRYLDRTVSIRGIDAPLRELVVAGLGRDRPTLALTNDTAETGRDLFTRYVGRNGIEDSIGSGVDFFHLNRLVSEVRLNVDLDAALTVVASGCYRWLATRLKGFEKAKPKLLFRKLVRTAGSVAVEQDHIAVHFDRRAHNPILRQAALDADGLCIPWAGNLPVRFTFAGANL